MSCSHSSRSPEHESSQPQTKSKQQRIRDNQRRSRARRQEYLAELEKQLDRNREATRDAISMRDYYIEKLSELEKNGASERYFCTFDDCYKKFRTKSGWMIHETGHHAQDEIFICRNSLSIGECYDHFYTENDFRDHLKSRHGIEADRSRVAAEISTALLDPQCVESYWCGFCRQVQKSQVRSREEAVDERYRHLIIHIEKMHMGQAQWFELRGRGRTKTQVAETNTAQSPFVNKHDAGADTNIAMFDLIEEEDTFSKFSVATPDKKPSHLNDLALEEVSEATSLVGQGASSDNLPEHLLYGPFRDQPVSRHDLRAQLPDECITQSLGSTRDKCLPHLVATAESTGDRHAGNESTSYESHDSGYGSSRSQERFQKCGGFEDDLDDRTVYSDDSTDTVRIESFVQLFADRLLQDLQITNVSELPSSDNLVVVLADFAARLGHGECSRDMRMALWFVYKHRMEICIAVRYELQQSFRNEEEDAQDSIESRRSQVESLGAKLDRFFMHEGSFEQDKDMPKESTQDHDYVHNLEPSEDGSAQSNPEFDRYASLVTEHAAYNWLLHQVRTGLLPNAAGCLSSNKIEQTVHAAVPKLKVLQRSKAPAMFRAEIEIRWSACDFFLHQAQDHCAEIPVLGDYVTLTGDILHAQATTCRDYVRQVWADGGIFVLNMLQNCLSRASLLAVSQQRDDGAIFTVYQTTPSTIMGVIGSRGVVTETLQLLAWMGAALSTQSEFLCTNTTILGTDITAANVHSTSHESDCKFTGPVSINCSNMCVRKFEIEYASRVQSIPFGQGTCWLPLLSGMSLVKEFPSRPRAEDLLGLELPFYLLPALVGAEYVQEYGGSLYIKGSSAMLVPTQLYKCGFLLWHLCANSSGEHISYNDHDQQTVKNIQISDLSRYRHIVGWCTSARFLIGTSEANYDIERARLPRARMSNGLGDSSLSAPYHVVKGAHFEFPSCCDSIHMRCKGMSNIMSKLSKQTFLLFDTGQNRGWLTNGITTLVHMLRTSLKHEERDTTGVDFLFRSTDLHESESENDFGFARAFLNNPSNMKLKISRSFATAQGSEGSKSDETEQFETLEDRVKQLHIMLEQASSYQESLRRQSRQSNCPRLPLRYLEGWDFVQMAMQTRYVDPCMTVLPPLGEACAALIRSTRIVTLFGEGFGELIQPNVNMCCERWNTLPTDRYYIAAGVADIRRIIEDEGHPKRSPPWLSTSPRLIWYTSSATADCGCLTVGHSNFPDGFIQTAWPFKDQHMLPAKSVDINFSDNGAVVFGHNTNLPYFLTDSGPQQGIPDSQVDAEEFESFFDDEGLGSSLKTVDSTESTQLATLPSLSLCEGHQYAEARFSGGHNIMGNVSQIHNHNTINYCKQQCSEIVLRTEESSEDVLDASMELLAGRGQKRAHEIMDVADPTHQEIDQSAPELGGTLSKRQKRSSFFDTILLKSGSGLK